MELKYLNYLATYKKIIRDSFATDKKAMKKLLAALDLYNQDKSKKAIGELNKLLKLCKSNSEFATVYTFLGICYEEIQFPMIGKEAYLKAIEFNDGISTVWSNLGLIYKNDGNFDEAISCFMKAIDIDKKNAYPYTNIGTLYYQMGENELALNYCKSALKIKGNLFQASEVICAIYLINGDMEMSKKYYQISVNSGSTKERMSRVLDEHKKFSELYNNALSLD